MKTKIIHEVRAVKNKKELANIVKAQRITEKVMGEAIKKLRTGISEIQMANFIDRSFAKHGAPILAFPSIVAFGKNTAHIHHEPNKTKLKKGDAVMFDIGCTVNHYCSDMTRTYFWGTPNTQQKKVYLAVREAQNRALALIKKGERNGHKIDKVARDFLKKKFPDNFKHSLGHGVGTVIHEWPFFRPKSKDTVPTGCVMTVEPGIYLKGFGGVRIEDIVLITSKSCKILTKIPSNLESIILQAPE